MLREVLRHERRLSHSDRREVSRAVFAYYRWLNWLDQASHLPRQVAEAVEFADCFAKEPGRFSDAELIQRAIPAWITGVMAALPSWVRGLQAEPKLWLRTKVSKTDRLRSLLGAGLVPWAAPGPMPPWIAAGLRASCFHYAGPADLFRLPAFHAGEFEIQDAASQAVGHCAAPQPGEIWWDACAGEGGKTLHWSDLMHGRGLIWASDRSRQRLDHLRRRAARAECFNYRAELWEGGARRPTRTLFDGVLVDAPCSGLGTWQRNPHARWTTSLLDVAELAGIQSQLLRHAAPSVKPGGRLVYAVCSLTEAETRSVTRRFLESHSDFAPHPELPITGLELWPSDSGGNGMYIAIWIRS